MLVPGFPEQTSDLIEGISVKGLGLLRATGVASGIVFSLPGDHLARAAWWRAEHRADGLCWDDESLNPAAAGDGEDALRAGQPRADVDVHLDLIDELLSQSQK